MKYSGREREGERRAERTTKWASTRLFSTVPNDSNSLTYTRTRWEWEWERERDSHHINIFLFMCTVYSVQQHIAYSPCIRWSSMQRRWVHTTSVHCVYNIYTGTCARSTHLPVDRCILVLVLVLARNCVRLLVCAILLLPSSSFSFPSYFAF